MSSNTSKLLSTRTHTYTHERPRGIVSDAMRCAGESGVSSVQVRCGPDGSGHPSDHDVQLGEEDQNADGASQPDKPHGAQHRQVWQIADRALQQMEDKVHPDHGEVQQIPRALEVVAAVSKDPYDDLPCLREG